MTPEEMERAVQALSGRPEYDWITQEGAPPWYRVTEVATFTGVTRAAVRGWCERGLIPGAVFYGPDMGWRMPRSGLLEYFAGLRRGSTAG